MGFVRIADRIPSVTGGLLNFIRVSVMSDILINSPASILAAYIIDQAIGAMTDPDDGNDWPLYVNIAPDGTGIKTNIGSMYDTPGVKDGRRMEGAITDHYGIQLRIRSADDIEGYTKAEILGVSMDTIRNNTVTIGANEYELQNISRQGPVISLGIEKGTTGRRLFTVNFLTMIKRIIS